MESRRRMRGKRLSGCEGDIVNASADSFTKTRQFQEVEHRKDVIHDGEEPRRVGHLNDLMTLGIKNQDSGSHKHNLSDIFGI